MFRYFLCFFTALAFHVLKWFIENCPRIYYVLSFIWYSYPYLTIWKISMLIYKGYIWINGYKSVWLFIRLKKWNCIGAQAWICLLYCRGWKWIFSWHHMIVNLALLQKISFLFSCRLLCVTNSPQSICFWYNLSL